MYHVFKIIEHVVNIHAMQVYDFEYILYSTCDNIRLIVYDVYSNIESSQRGYYKQQTCVYSLFKLVL